MNLWWKCPKCKSKVDFQKQIDYLFEEDGEASFVVDKGGGAYFHTIECENCDAQWIVSISGLFDEEIETEEGRLI